LGKSDVPNAAFARSGTHPARDRRARRRATLPAVHWLFTGLLVGVSGATAVYTLWLVRRLFTTAPAPAPVPDEQAEAAP